MEGPAPGGGGAGASDWLVKVGLDFGQLTADLKKLDDLLAKSRAATAQNTTEEQKQAQARKDQLRASEALIQAQQKMRAEQINIVNAIASQNTQVKALNSMAEAYVGQLRMCVAELTKAGVSQKQINEFSEQWNNSIRNIRNTASLTAKDRQNQLVTEEKVTAEVEKQDKSLRGMAAVLQQIGLRQREVNQSLFGQNQGLQSIMGKVSLWLSATSIVYGTIRGIESALRTISKIDFEQTMIAKLYRGSNMQENVAAAGQLTRAAGGLGAIFGIELPDVQKQMEQYVRMGYHVADTVKLVTSSLLLQKAGDMEAAESAKIMTAAMNEYGLSVEQVRVLVDELNQTQNTTAAETKEVAIAIALAGNKAKQAGIDIQQLISLSSTAIVSTGQGGSRIGTNLGTMFQYLRKIAGAKEFSQVGIETEDVSGHLKGGFQILEELAAKWDLLTAAERRNLTERITGSRRSTELIALMENWSKVLATITQEYESAGSASSEVALRQDTIIAKVERIHSILQDIMAGVGRQGLVGAIKSDLDYVIDKLLQVDRIDPARLQNIINMVVELVAALAGFKSGGMIGEAIGGILGAFGGPETALAGAALGKSIGSLVAGVAAPLVAFHEMENIAEGAARNTTDAINKQADSFESLNAKVRQGVNLIGGERGFVQYLDSLQLRLKAINEANISAADKEKKKQDAIAGVEAAYDNLKAAAIKAHDVELQNALKMIDINGMKHDSVDKLIKQVGDYRIQIDLLSKAEVQASIKSMEGDISRARIDKLRALAEWTTSSAQLKEAEIRSHRPFTRGFNEAGDDIARLTPLVAQYRAAADSALELIRKGPEILAELRARFAAFGTEPDNLGPPLDTNKPGSGNRGGGSGGPGSIPIAEMPPDWKFGHGEFVNIDTLQLFGPQLLSPERQEQLLRTLVASAESIHDTTVESLARQFEIAAGQSPVALALVRDIAKYQAELAELAKEHGDVTDARFDASVASSVARIVKALPKNATIEQQRAYLRNMRSSAAGNLSPVDVSGVITRQIGTSGGLPPDIAHSISTAGVAIGLTGQYNTDARRLSSDYATLQERIRALSDADNAAYQTLLHIQESQQAQDVGIAGVGINGGVRTLFDIARRGVKITKDELNAAMDLLKMVNQSKVTVGKLMDRIDGALRIGVAPTDSELQRVTTIIDDAQKEIESLADDAKRLMEGGLGPSVWPGGGGMPVRLFPDMPYTTAESSPTDEVNAIADALKAQMKLLEARRNAIATVLYGQDMAKSMANWFKDQADQAKAFVSDIERDLKATATGDNVSLHDNLEAQMSALRKVEDQLSSASPAEAVRAPLKDEITNIRRSIASTLLSIFEDETNRFGKQLSEVKDEVKNNRELFDVGQPKDDVQTLRQSIADNLLVIKAIRQSVWDEAGAMFGLTGAGRSKAQDVLDRLYAEVRSLEHGNAVSQAKIDDILQRNQAAAANWEYSGLDPIRQAIEQARIGNSQIGMSAYARAMDAANRQVEDMITKAYQSFIAANSMEGVNPGEDTRWFWYKINGLKDDFLSAVMEGLVKTTAEQLSREHVDAQVGLNASRFELSQMGGTGMSAQAAAIRFRYRQDVSKMTSDTGWGDLSEAQQGQKMGDLAEGYRLELEKMYKSSFLSLRDSFASTLADMLGDVKDFGSILRNLAGNILKTAMGNMVNNWGPTRGIVTGLARTAFRNQGGSFNPDLGPAFVDSGAGNIPLSSSVGSSSGGSSGVWSSSGQAVRVDIAAIGGGPLPTLGSPAQQGSRFIPLNDPSGKLPTVGGANTFSQALGLYGILSNSMQGGDPLMGGIQGALSGLSLGNPILAGVGGVLGLLGGLFGGHHRPPAPTTPISLPTQADIMWANPTGMPASAYYGGRAGSPTNIGNMSIAINMPNVTSMGDFEKAGQDFAKGFSQYSSGMSGLAVTLRNERTRGINARP